MALETERNEQSGKERVVDPGVVVAGVHGQKGPHVPCVALLLASDSRVRCSGDVLAHEGM